MAVGLRDVGRAALQIGGLLLQHVERFGVPHQRRVGKGRLGLGIRVGAAHRTQEPRAGAERKAEHQGFGDALGVVAGIELALQHFGAERGRGVADTPLDAHPETAVERGGASGGSQHAGTDQDAWVGHGTHHAAPGGGTGHCGTLLGVLLAGVALHDPAGGLDRRGAVGEQPRLVLVGGLGKGRVLERVVVLVGLNVAHRRLGEPGEAEVVEQDRGQAFLLAVGKARPEVADLCRCSIRLHRLCKFPRLEVEDRAVAGDQLVDLGRLLLEAVGRVLDALPGDHLLAHGVGRGLGQRLVGRNRPVDHPAQLFLGQHRLGVVRPPD